MTKYLLLTVVTFALTAPALQAEGSGCSGCKGKDKAKEKTEQKS
ncbi:MAG: hypothetical protein ACFCUX_03960 [Candidatus Methylacidiphilales bacterium]